MLNPCRALSQDPKETVVRQSHESLMLERDIVNKKVKKVNTTTVLGDDRHHKGSKRRKL